MSDDKQVRKITRCIQTLLEAEGVKVSATKVKNFIKDKDLSNIPALKDEVVTAINDMRSSEETNKSSTKPDRRRQIETFCVANWDSIRNNQFVKDALFNAYSQGRYNKEQRQELKNELLAICNGEEPDESADVPTESETALADDTNAELAATLMGGGTHYDF